MKTILVPTDFSETAKNASLYAIDLAKQVKAKKIILYNTYQAPVSVGPDPMVPVLEVFDLDTVKKANEENLQLLKFKFLAFCDKDIVIDTLCEFNMLAQGVEEICGRMDIDLIVMGITGGGAVEETVFGSNTVKVARTIKVPVIIVPAKANYTSVDKIALVTDFEKVNTSIPVEPIKKILQSTGAELNILHVEKSGNYNKDNAFESVEMDKLFTGFEPKYHFIHNQDFADAINDFVFEQQIDLVIIVPKKHGLFETIFKKSHTKHLAFHSNIPLMVVHE
jgi:nucleotide-binding universal stress UspA family protein